MTNNPFLAPEALEPQGVPISAIIFGGRRAAAVPLLVQAFDWSHGVFLGATMASEMTAAASGGNGQLRRDPMAMVPFCGYHISDYFRHWLSMGQRLRQPPRIFHVNWFRRGPDGEFLWPGFGENMRVLKWICDRCHGRVAAVESPLGWMPHRDDFDLQNLNGFGAEDFARVQRVDAQEWLEEIRDQDEFFGKLRDNLPKELVEQRRLLMERLGVTNV